MSLFCLGAGADKRKGIVMTDHTERPSAFRLNLEQQKNRAKDLLRGAKAGDAEALSRLAAVRPDSVARNTLDTMQTTAKLADAQFVIARELRFASWAMLKSHIASMDRHRAAINGKSPAPDGDLKTLHIRCGHDIQQPLVEAGFVGDFLVDAYPYGTMPLTTGSDRLELLARALIAPSGKSLNGQGYEEALEDLRRLEQQLHASADDYERVVIWMEHDSYDQLVLARLLALYATAKRPPTFELIAVDEFPGSQRFIGIGQLPPEALRLLWPSRRPVTAAQLALGKEAWTALSSDDPMPLAALVRCGTPALPIMAPALHRHLRELPSVENGLRLSEQLILRILCDRGPVRRNPLFGLLLERDPLPYNGDLRFFDLIDYMIAGSMPLVTVVRTPVNENQFRIDVAITELGRAVLRGERDWLSLRPPARWVGGVHIQPGVPGWRWDEAKRDAVLG
jgi:hypothetical protein